MKVTNEAIRLWLAQNKGVEISREFIGMVRKGSRGSKHAAAIHEAELAILEQQGREVRKQIIATGKAYGLSIS